MARATWDILFISAGALLIVGATLLDPASEADEVAGGLGFVLVLLGA